MRLLPAVVTARARGAVAVIDVITPQPLRTCISPRHHSNRNNYRRYRPLNRASFSTTTSKMSGTQGILAEAFSASVQQPTTLAQSPADYDNKPHHVQGGKGGFVNPWNSWQDLGIAAIVKGILQHRHKQGFSGPATRPAPNVVTPSFPSTRSTEDSKFRATWLGHACYYVEFPAGLRVLFDPVFSERCSPVQFTGPKRYTKKPCEIEDLPAVDIVCISHNHYDHTDYNTIMKLQKIQPNVHYFVPLGNKEWFTCSGVENCTELDWWDEREVVLNPSDLNGGTVSAKLGLLPCQHTSGRGLTDRSMTLWGSWSVESGGKKVYFAGDTGYRAVPKESEGTDDYADEYKDLPVCPAFKQIGELRGGFDLGLIPIGAYVPRWIMSPMHADPKDAVNIFLDTRCEKALGMHWGTWVLTDEPVMEPPEKLKQALREKGIEEVGVFDVLDIGGSKEF